MEKKLQKVEVLGNGFCNSEKKVDEVSKSFYMDECDFDVYDSKDMAQYFCNNYERVINNNNNYPEYIGMPLMVLENGSVINEYDENFRNQYINRVSANKISEGNLFKNKQNNKVITKLKSFFNKITGRSNTKMLNASVEPELRKFGVNSVEELNRYDPDIQILDKNLGDELGKLTNDERTVTNSDIEKVNNNKVVEKNSIEYKEI